VKGQQNESVVTVLAVGLSYEVRIPRGGKVKEAVSGSFDCASFFASEETLLRSG
jgi:hypothetical protein